MAKEKLSIIKLTMTLIMSLVVSFAAVPASGSGNAPYESRLTVTVTTTEVGTGPTRTVSYTVDVADSAADLTTGTPTGNQVKVFGIVIFMCATQQPVSSVGFALPSGCTYFQSSASANVGTAASRQYTRDYPGSSFDNNISSYPFITPTIHFQDAAGNQLAIHGNATASQSQPSPSSSVTPSRYEGPEILVVDTVRPITSGGKLTFNGKNLSAVSSATIGSLAASLSYDATTGLTIGTPAGLTPGKYDLVMQSSYGKLTHINAVTIKAPTPTVTIGFKGEGEYLNEAQVAELVEFNSSLNADYEKVRCIVNAADPEVAKALAVRVCAHVARGEARNVEAIQDVRSTFKGSGFWVRVYAAG